MSSFYINEYFCHISHRKCRLLTENFVSQILFMLHFDVFFMFYIFRLHFNSYLVSLLDEYYRWISVYVWFLSDYQCNQTPLRDQITRKWMPFVLECCSFSLEFCYFPVVLSFFSGLYSEFTLTYLKQNSSSWI